MSDDKGTPTAKVGTISGGNPELRFSPSGTAYAKFSLRVKPWAPEVSKVSPPVLTALTVLAAPTVTVAVPLALASEQLMPW